MTLSRVPELAELEAEVGPGRCCFCKRPITKKRPNGNAARVCFRADCRIEEETARSRHRYAATRGLRALRDVVAAIGWSTNAISRLTGAKR